MLGGIPNVGMISTTVDLDTYNTTSGFCGIFTKATNAPANNTTFFVAQIGIGIQCAVQYYSGALYIRGNKNDGWVSWTPIQ